MKTGYTVVAGLTISALLACGSDATGPSKTIAGIYTLRTLAGYPLPVNVVDPSSGNQNQFLVADTLVLRADGTWSETDIWGPAPDFSDVAVGTYRHSGTAVLLTETGFGSLTGTVDDSVITTTAWGWPAIYWKQ